MNLSKIIKICSRNYNLKFDKTTGISSCDMAREKDGKGEMIIGTEYSDLEGQTEFYIYF